MSNYYRADETDHEKLENAKAERRRLESQIHVLTTALAQKEAELSNMKAVYETTRGWYNKLVDEKAVLEKELVAALTPPPF